MSADACASVGNVGASIAVFAVIIVTIVIICAVGGSLVDEFWTSPDAQRERLERREQRAKNARMRQLMEAGMSYRDAEHLARREREWESEAVVRSVIDAEKAMRRDGIA